MLKKTTIYIEETELDTLKALSLIQNKSVTELVRLGVKKVCKEISSEEMKALDALTKIKREMKNSDHSNKDIMATAIKAQKEVRRERKQNSRR